MIVEIFFIRVGCVCGRLRLVFSYFFRAHRAGPKEDSPVVATVTESIIVGTDTEDDMTDGMQVCHVSLV